MNIRIFDSHFIKSFENRSNSDFRILDCPLSNLSVNSQSLSWNFCHVVTLSSSACSTNKVLDNQQTFNCTNTLLFVRSTNCSYTPPNALNDFHQNKRFV